MLLICASSITVYCTFDWRDESEPTVVYRRYDSAVCVYCRVLCTQTQRDAELLIEFLDCTAPSPSTRTGARVHLHALWASFSCAVHPSTTNSHALNKRRSMRNKQRSKYHPSTPHNQSKAARQSTLPSNAYFRTQEQPAKRTSYRRAKRVDALSTAVAPSFDSYVHKTILSHL